MGTLAQHATRYLLERRARQELSRATTMSISYTLLSLDKSFGDRPLTKFGARAIERWSEQNPHWKKSTRATRLGQARTFSRWLIRRKLIKTDPFLDMRLPRRQRPSPKPMSQDDIHKLLRVVPDARGRLIVHLQWGLGLRCCGCANLLVENIDLHGRSFCVFEKGSERRLPITNDLYRALDMYLWEHPATSGPLLRSYRHDWEPLTAKYIGKIVTQWQYAAGVKRRPFDGVSPHALRRTRLTEVAEATGDAFVLAELAGWADISTAAHYVRRASTERVRAALEAR